MRDPQWRCVRLFDVPIHAMRMEEVIALAEQRIDARQPLLIGVVNAAKMVNMRRDELLRRSVLDAHLILADGMAVVWACRMLGTPLPERVTGIDLMEHLLSLSHRRKFRVYCLGATQEVLDATVGRIGREYPNAIVAGSHHGYFGPDGEAAVAADIRQARPDILLVAMSSPKKEQFLARWADDLSIPICHGVGGAFDVFAGMVRRAPALWQRLGLEWLYRVLQEPGRLWKRYLVTNAVFTWWVVRARLGRIAHSD